MRRISTGIEQLSTTDDVADAVLTYATALARSGTADTVTILIVLEGGAVDEARLLIGPASQLTLIPDDGSEVDLPTAVDVVDDLHRRIRRLQPAPIPAEDRRAELPALDEVDE